MNVFIIIWIAGIFLALSIRLKIFYTSELYDNIKIAIRRCYLEDENFRNSVDDTLEKYEIETLDDCFESSKLFKGIRNYIYLTSILFSWVSLLASLITVLIINANSKNI